MSPNHNTAPPSHCLNSSSRDTHGTNDSYGMCSALPSLPASFFFFFFLLSTGYISIGHPWQYGRLMFMHNGNIADFHLVSATLSTLLWDRTKLYFWAKIPGRNERDTRPILFFFWAKIPERNEIQGRFLSFFFFFLLTACCCSHCCPPPYDSSNARCRNH